MCVHKTDLHSCLRNEMLQVRQCHAALQQTNVVRIRMKVLVCVGYYDPLLRIINAV